MYKNNGCSSLASVVFPSNLTTIETSAFQDCTSLTSITFPDAMTDGLGAYSFYGCTNLSTIIFGSGITRIPSDCFYGCTSLNQVTIPANVAIIQDAAFGKSTLSVLYMEGSTPPSLDSTAFTSCSNLGNIFVPSDAVDTYKSATNWSKYADIIQANPNE